LVHLVGLNYAYNVLSKHHGKGTSHLYAGKTESNINTVKQYNKKYNKNVKLRFFVSMDPCGLMQIND